MSKNLKFEDLDGTGRFQALLIEKAPSANDLINRDSIRGYNIINRRNLAFVATGLMNSKTPENDPGMKDILDELSKSSVFILTKENIDEMAATLPNLRTWEIDNLRKLVNVKEEGNAYYILPKETVNRLEETAPANVDMTWIKLRRCDHMIRIGRELIENILAEDPSADVSIWQSGVDAGEIVKRKIEAGEDVEF